MSDQAEALWYVGPEKAEIRAEPLAPAAGAVRVRTLYTGLSRGTERLVFSGRVPDTEYERMRAPHMGGQFPFPVKYGYAAVGRAESGAFAGRNVFALYPHQSAFALPPDSLVRLPDNVPPQRAVLAANMETALNAVWDGGASAADRIAVVGAGVVGALVAYLCARMPGADVTLIDTEPSRATLARALGVNFSAPDRAPQDFGPKGCDLVVHASGHAEGLRTALSLAGDEATVLEMSWYGAGDVAVPLGGAFHSRRLKLVASQVGRVAPSHRARWSYRRRLEAALTLLADDRLDALLSPAIAFRDLPAALPRIFADRSVLCQVIAYPS